MTLHMGIVMEWNLGKVEKCSKALKNNQIWSTKQGINPAQETCKKGNVRSSLLVCLQKVFLSHQELICMPALHLKPLR